MDRIAQHSHQYEPNNNNIVHKTKQMVINKTTITGARIYVNQTKIDKVKQYCYLSTVINERWDNTQKVKCHMGKVRIRQSIRQNERNLQVMT